MSPWIQRYAVSLGSLLVVSGAAAEVNTPFRLANVIIPASFASALRDGLSVPVQLRYQDSLSGTDTTTEDAVGSATLILKGDAIYLLNVDFSEQKGHGLLNDSLIAKLSVDDERKFDSQGKLYVDNDATMHLDLIAMQMVIQVSRTAFNSSHQNNDSKELMPSIHELTSVHRYNFGYSFNNSDAIYLDSNYLQLGSTLSFAADHLFLDGSLYNLGKEGQNGQLYRAMYERDLDNRRIAGGMVSTWDLQSLGLVSALNTGRIYGASYGNQAFSRQSGSDNSTTPVQVFMPANGEVHVYRDDRMLAVVNLPIGNQTLDTKTFPNGVYNVTVEVYVDGRLVNTSTQRVTKLGGNNQFVDNWGWQAWGGMMEPSMESQSNSPLAGISMSRTHGAFTFSSSGYTFSEATVGEGSVRWHPMDNFNVGGQTMLSSEGSYRIGSNLNLRILDNLTFWGAQEKLVNGSRLTLSESDQVSMGASLNLGGWVNRLGLVSVNTTHDRISNKTRTYLDYSQNIYSGTYGTLSARGSLQNTGTGGGWDNKSITLDYSIPLGSRFSLGISSNELGQTMTNLGYQTYLDGVINQVAINANKVLNDDTASSPALSSSVGFGHKLASGAFSVNRTSQGDLNGNLTARGAVGQADKYITLTGKGDSNAGILIDTGQESTSQMLAKINGLDYLLEGKESFITLAPYQEYEVELLNSKSSLGSYEINTGKVRYTLFPGNVAKLDASLTVREMVTVFGVIRAEDGSLLSNARIDNHIGTTMTNEVGEFSLDVDKANPMLMFKRGDDYCEVDLDIRNENGAAWVGDIICQGLPSYVRI